MTSSTLVSFRHVRKSWQQVTALQNFNLDIAAGELLVREAGGLVCDFTGDSNHLSEGHIVAGAPKVVKEMLMRMRPLLPAAMLRG